MCSCEPGHHTCRRYVHEADAAVKSPELNPERAEALSQRVKRLERELVSLSADFDNIDATSEDDRVCVAACETSMALMIAHDAVMRAGGAARSIVRYNGGV